MMVELDVFSGRPNPRWELDEIHSRQLRQLQSQLEPTSQGPVEPPALGYRGFYYSDPTGRVHAYHGHLKAVSAALADPSFSVERYLIEQIPAEFAAVGSRITAEITGWL